MNTDLTDESTFLVFDSEEDADQALAAIDNAKLLKNAALRATEQGPGTYILIIRVDEDNSARLSIVKA